MSHFYNDVYISLVNIIRSYFRHFHLTDVCIPGPSYPSSLRVSNARQGIHVSVRECLGVYKMESGLTQHGRPVWGRTKGSYKMYIFYGSDGYWRIDYDYKKDRGLMSEQSGLRSVPETGWKVFDGRGRMISDPAMRVVAL